MLSNTIIYILRRYFQSKENHSCSTRLQRQRAKWSNLLLRYQRTII